VNADIAAREMDPTQRHEHEVRARDLAAKARAIREGKAKP
jgi:hypothetical protein